MFRLSCLGLALIAVVGGCPPEQPSRARQGSRAPTARPTSADARAPEASPSRELGPDPAATARPEAGAMVAIEAGTVRAGSTPGSPGRVPELEMDDHEVALARFEIDALPYPDDPGREPMTGVTYQQAQNLCRQAGKRLCHELEWELACEGSAGRTYPYGNEYQEDRYQDRASLASPFGVRGQGTLAEWTDSHAAAAPIPDPASSPDASAEAEPGPDAAAGGGSTVRGPGETPTAANRRCASRTVVAPDTAAPWLGFRCCRGEPQAEDAAYQTVAPSRPFTRMAELCEVPRFQAMIRSVPELRQLWDNPQPYAEGDLYSVMHRSGFIGPNVIRGMWFSWQPVRWIPRQGEELIVTTGHDDPDAFVAVLYALPDGRYRHAASLVFLNHSPATVLGYTRDRRQLEWVPCLGCRDGGLITYLDGRVEITQRW